MYETTKSERVYRFLKYANILLVVFFLATVLVKIVILPATSGDIGFKIFTTIVLSLFMVPYLLCIRAFPPQKKMVKGAIVVSVVWCLFIIVGVTSMQQGVFVNSICAVLFIVSIVNIFYLIKSNGGNKIA